MSEKDLQKQIDDAVEKATKALKDKNDELLTELKDSKKKMADIAKRLEDADAEKTKTEEALEEEKAKKAGDFDKQKKLLEDKHAKELAKRDEAISGLNGQLHGLLIDNGLNDALVAAKVAPQFKDAALALIKSKHKVEVVTDADGKPVAQVDGKKISEFIPAWSQGEHGKNFVAAPGNGGGGAGGANGNGGAGSGKTMARADFGKLSATEQMKLSKEGVTLTDAA